MLNTFKFAELLKEAPHGPRAFNLKILTLDKLKRAGFDGEDIAALVQKFSEQGIIIKFVFKPLRVNPKIQAFGFQINPVKLQAFLTPPAPPLVVAETSNTLYDKIRPYCEITKGWGYLKFSPKSQPIKIGKPNSQTFRLLQSLTEPFGIAKSVESVFEAIRENVKVKNKSGVYTGYTDKGQKLKLLSYAIKELQKDNKLQGKLEFKFDELKKRVWLDYTG
jgi:hypothetical protein